MRIAILASDTGEKALHLYEFFREGNRVEVDCLITDSPESPLISIFEREGIPSFVIGREEWPSGEKLTALLEERGAEIIVVDNLESPLPETVMERFGSVIIYPTGVREAPNEVVALYKQLQAKSVAESRQGEKKKEKSENPSPEEEWADALKVEYDEEEAAERAAQLMPLPPADPVDEAPVNGENPEEITETNEAQTPGTPPPPMPNGSSFNQGRPNYEPRNPFGNRVSPPRSPFDREGQEPMPETYLVWSVIATILCCLIPGIIAIIYSAAVSTKYYAHDIEGAKRASRQAQIWIIISVICAILWTSLYIPLMLIAG